MTRMRIRIDFESGGSIGPGKIALLERIRDTGSISAAGRALGMSYRRAWLLVDDLNRIFREPVVSAAVGGKHGGGTVLTAFGEQVIDHYRAVEREAHVATAHRLAALAAVIDPDYRTDKQADDGSFANDPGVGPGCAKPGSE